MNSESEEMLDLLGADIERARLSTISSLSMQLSRIVRELSCRLYSIDFGVYTGITWCYTVFIVGFDISLTLYSRDESHNTLCMCSQISTFLSTLQTIHVFK